MQSSSDEDNSVNANVLEILKLDEHSSESEQETSDHDDNCALVPHLQYYSEDSIMVEEEVSFSYMVKVAIYRGSK